MIPAKGPIRKLCARLDSLTGRLRTIAQAAEDATIADSYLKAWASSHLHRRAQPSSAQFQRYVERLQESGFFTRGILEVFSTNIIKLLGREGVLGYLVPKRYGGECTAVSAMALCLIRKHLAAYSGLVDALFAVQGLGSYPVAIAGTERQKKRWLPRVASGDIIPAFAITEPGAGSDIASITTRAIKRRDGYIIRGTKTLISNAAIADYFVVFARTGKSPGRDSLTAFIVDAHSHGVTVTRKMDLMAPHPIGELKFDCLVPAEARLGREGAGFRIAVRTLEMFRASVGAAAVGLATRAFEEAVSYVKKRRQFDRPLAEFEAVRFDIADMVTRLKASELMVFNSASLAEGAEPDGMSSSMAKLYATEAAQKIIDTALQLHGGKGVVKGTTVERLYREIRALRIYEGTSEIQKLIISKRILNKI